MAQYDQKTFDQYEERLKAVEAQCLTEEEREINQFVFRVVKSVRMTLWLTNGLVKYGAGPIGIAFGLWVWGESAVDWIVSKATGLPK